MDTARLMAPGWNLGNSFDASPNETSWGNPTPTQTLVNGVHAGFKTLRLPVTWTNHIGAAPSYTIDSAWMNKVKQTAQWAVDAGSRENGKFGPVEPEQGSDAINPLDDSGARVRGRSLLGIAGVIVRKRGESGR